MKPTDPRHGMTRIERMAYHRKQRELEGYYTPEAVAKREQQLEASREYNARIAAMFTKPPR